METRAVRVSYELWLEMLTEGYTTGGLRCIRGIPDGATLIGARLYDREAGPDPVLLFASDNWTRPPRKYPVIVGSEHFPEADVVFQVSECRTCQWWEKERIAEYSDQGRCYAGGVVIDCEYGKSKKLTRDDFGCTSYEPRETK